MKFRIENLMIFVFTIILIIDVLLVIQMQNINSSLTKTWKYDYLMKPICDDKEIYTYHVGWTEVCEFEVRRGTCLDESGITIDSSGWVLSNGKVWYFNDLPLPEREEEHSPTDIQIKEWENKMCNIFSGD